MWVPQHPRTPHPALLESFQGKKNGDTIHGREQKSRNSCVPERKGRKRLTQLLLCRTRCQKIRAKTRMKILNKSLQMMCGRPATQLCALSLTRRFCCSPQQKIYITA